MRRTAFVPARSSRHRASALALYRALLRSAVKCDNVGSNNDGEIKSVITSQFRKNTTYTSSRLTYAAMVAGYKYLTFLQRATDVQSIEYSQIKELLQTRKPDRQRKRPIPRQLGAQKEDRTDLPLIYNTTRAGELPHYVSSLKPRLDTNGQGPKKPPVLATTALGMPFLRRKKPQPYTMSRMIGVKSKRFENKVQNIVAVEEWMAPDAALEDAWDALVEQQQRDEAGDPRSEAPDTPPEETYTWSVQLSRAWWEWQAEKTWQDWLARGKALQAVVTAETLPKSNSTGVVEQAASLLEEKLRLGRRSDGRQSTLPSKSDLQSKGQALQADVAFKPATTLPLSLLVQQPKLDDPFCSKAWLGVIDYHRSRLFKYTLATLRRTDVRPKQSPNRER